MAAWNIYRAREAERRHPPSGRFMSVEGVRLHYLERGEGRPVVLLHGNGVTGEDFELSRVLGLAAQSHRVIAFDRPGFGYSGRPRGTVWNAARQARLLRQALAAIALEPAVVIGHSWGTLVASALALDYPEAVRSLILLSGYYYPTLRADVALFSPPAIPVIGDFLRYTVVPPLTAAMLPAMVKRSFAPLPVPDRFAKGFPAGLALRPSQRSLDRLDLDESGEDRANRLGLRRIGNQLAVDCIEAKRNGSSHPHALYLRGRDLVPDPLGADLALELGE